MVLEKSGKGYKYILSVIDAFTKFCKFYPCKSTSANEIIKHLKTYFQCYSKPQRIVSNRRSAFTSTTFREFLENESISQVLIATGTPRANGQVERIHRTITPMFSKLCDRPDKWSNVINEVEFAINNTVCRSTGDTPSKLLFGVNQVGKIDDKLKWYFEQRQAIDRNLELIREGASNKILKVQKCNEELYNKRRKKATIYSIGDLVMIKNVDTTPGVNKKFIPKYKGPYEVTKVLDKDRYIVSDVEGFQITQLPYVGTIAVDQMKKYLLSRDEDYENNNSSDSV